MGQALIRLTEQVTLLAYHFPDWKVLIAKTGVRESGKKAVLIQKGRDGIVSPGCVGTDSTLHISARSILPLHLSLPASSSTRTSGESHFKSCSWSHLITRFQSHSRCTVLVIF